MRQKEKDSGWALVSLLYLEINVAKYNPLRASSYLPLPKDIAAKNAVINVRNSGIFHSCSYCL
ncbi:hypothetical protein NQ314_020009 [Rhamnusium bicolor]|uniref:Uncharacterized protein n=1 Tax=Rhamnusium bicolor TaxID=1586634 RepID=A0AAV8WLP2_9CUCU|nr:hypothetical protein NQ314_020009 [Rhamnusium bicolor]